MDRQIMQPASGMKKAFLLGLSEEGFHRIAYTEWGTPAEIPILCAHGLTRNGRDFDSLAKYLSQRGKQVFCPDIVGRGDSDWLKNPLHYTFEQYVADMNAMIARTNASQIDWIGTSMGGIIGMILASMKNSPIRRLVLNDIGAHIPAKGLVRMSQYAGKDPTFNSISEAKHYFKTIYSDFGNLSDQDWDHLTKNSIREIAPGKFVSKLDHNIKVPQAKSKMAWQMLLHPIQTLEGTVFDIDLWNYWNNVKCPVFVIHGEHSDILLQSTILKMRENRTNIEVMEVPNTGHAPALIDSAQHEKIDSWLRRD